MNSTISLSLSSGIFLNNPIEGVNFRFLWQTRTTRSIFYGHAISYQLHNCFVAIHYIPRARLSCVKNWSKPSVSNIERICFAQKKQKHTRDGTCGEFDFGRSASIVHHVIQGDLSGLARCCAQVTCDASFHDTTLQIATVYYRPHDRLHAYSILSRDK